MTQFYSDPSREDNPHALPDCEAFFMDDDLCADFNRGASMTEGTYTPGWYWWARQPGCLASGDPIGPFDTRRAAMDDGRGL